MSNPRISSCFFMHFSSFNPIFSKRDAPPPPPPCNAPATQDEQTRKYCTRKVLKNSVKMGVSKIVKNVKFYLLKFYFA